MDYSREALDRQAKIESLKNAWVICYADRFPWKQDISDLRKMQALPHSDELMQTWASWQVKTAWRLVLSRAMWKLLFWKIIDHTGAIQLCFLKDNSSKYFYWFWRKICFQNRREICTNMRLYRCYLRLIFNKTLRINYFCKRVSNFEQSCKTTSGKISLTCRYRNCLQTKIPWFDNKWRKFWKI